MGEKEKTQKKNAIFFQFFIGLVTGFLIAAPLSGFADSNEDRSDEFLEGYITAVIENGLNLPGIL